MSSLSLEPYIPQKPKPLVKTINPKPFKRSQFKQHPSNQEDPTIQASVVSILFHEA